MNKTDTVTVIRSLLTSTNSSYSLYSLNKDFKNETGIDIPLFGYGNLIDFLHSIPDTVQLTGIYPIQQVSLVANNKSAHIASLVKRQKSIKLQKGGTLFRPKSCSTKITIDGSFRPKEIQESKFSERKNFSYNLKEVSESYNWTLLKQKASLRCGNQNVPNPSLSSSEKILSDSVLSSGEKIPLIDLDLSCEVGKYVEVFLCQIFNPHRFYLHFRKNKKRLSIFMDKLQIFYTSKGSMFQMGDDSLKTGRICAALFHGSSQYGKWYRSEVTEIVNDSQVVVFLIDYGITANICKENLRFLHRDFSLLPRQAVLSCLANIIPSEDDLKWTESANKRFYDLAFGKDLVAGIVNINTEKSSMSVALSCTSGFEIHINDTLVYDGHATFKKEPLDFYNAREYRKSKFFEPKEEQWHENTASTEDCVKRSPKSFRNCVSINPSVPFYSLTNNSRLKKFFLINRTEWNE